MQDLIARIVSFVRRPKIFVPLLMALVLAVGFLYRIEIRNLITAKERPISIVTGQPLPEYKGRSIRDIKDDPKVVSVFTKEQLDSIHQKISDAVGSIDVNPDVLDPWLQLGLYKYEIGDFIGARDAWAYAGVIRPNNAISFKNLGDLYWHQLNDNHKAELNYLKLIENDPAYLPGYISLSELYRFSYTEKTSQAEGVLLNGLKTATDDPDMIAYIARFYKETGNKSKAIEFYKKLKILRPSDTSIDEELRALGA